MTKHNASVQAHGPIIPIGGAEDLNPNNGETILAEFVRLSGGKRAHIAVIPTASADPGKTARGYTRLFRKLGVQNAASLEIEQREDANSEETLELLRWATGIFITGGDQERLVSLLVGTRAMEGIRQCNMEGTVVAGTSAGASILSAHMLVPGEIPGVESNNGSPRRGATEMVSGLGLLQDIIIDQHFSQRGRIGRLLDAFAANPGLLGLGIDEDTAAICDATSCLTVIGSGAVTIIDGRNATSDYFERAPGEVVSVFDSHIFVLGPGRQFNLSTRRPISLDEKQD